MRWAPAQQDPSACFFLSIIVALFATTDPDELTHSVRNGAWRDTFDDDINHDEETLDTRMPALMVALHELRAIVPEECVDALLVAVGDLAQTPITNASDALHTATQARAQLHKSIDQGGLHSAVTPLLLRKLREYNAARDAVSRVLYEHAPRTPSSPAAIARMTRVWRAVDAIAAAARRNTPLEDVNLSALLSDERVGTFSFLSGIARARDAATQRRPEGVMASSRSQDTHEGYANLQLVAERIEICREIQHPPANHSAPPNSSAWRDAHDLLVSIADVMRQTRADRVEPERNETRMRSGTWRTDVLHSTYPHLLRNQQDANETVLALLHILGVRATAQRVRVKLSVPSFWARTQIGASESLQIAEANARMMHPALPYLKTESAGVVTLMVSREAEDVEQMFPAVDNLVTMASGGEDERRIVTVDLLEGETPRLLLLTNNMGARGGRPLRYGTFGATPDAPPTACTMSLRRPRTLEALHHLPQLAALPTEDDVHVAVTARTRSEGPSARFRLRSVVCWRGSANGTGGHYTAWTHEDGAWFFYNSAGARISLQEGATPEDRDLDPRVGAWAPSLCGILFLYERAR